MKQHTFFAFLFAICYLLLSGTGYAQSPIKLSYPPQDGAPTCYSGVTIDLTPRDQFESSELNFSHTGPVVYTINGITNPSTISSGFLNAQVCADTNSQYFPQPGNEYQATLDCSYKITYSSPLNPLYEPHGGNSATNVYQSTGSVWLCAANPDAACAGGHTSPAEHTLVTETGNVQFVFLVNAGEKGEVRIQVQQGRKNISSESLKALPDKDGVTKQQGYQCLARLSTDAQAKDGALNKNEEFKSAIIRMSEKIKAVKGGLSKGQNQTTLQEKFKAGKPLVEYRIDLEVIRGTNFKE